MAHQGTNFRTKSAHLRGAMQWLLAGIVWERSLHASCSWTFRWLTVTALAWAWSNEGTLRERFSCAQRLTRFLQKTTKKTKTSQQAFIEILCRHTCFMRDVLLRSFRALMIRTFPNQWTQFGFVIFGVDGTDISTARTKSNEAAFTTDGKSPHQKRKKRKTRQNESLRRNPRILLTTFYHLALGLAWDWRMGGKSDNERSQVRAMLGELPAKSLIVGDAGFVGFDFLTAVIDSNADVIVRVGANVRLLRNLGNFKTAGNIVYMWPREAAKRNRQPLVFRLVVLRAKRHPLYLISSVLDAEVLSDAEHAQIYWERWGIEMYHRDFKQTFASHRMLSKKAENAIVELQWRLLSLLAMSMYATKQIIENGMTRQQMSMANVLRAFRQTARDYQHPIDRETLNFKIQRAIKDNYNRKTKKESRNYPKRTTKHKQPGKPQIKNAKIEQRQKAAQVLNSNRSLTA